jgi:elongation factor 1-alpha
MTDTIAQDLVQNKDHLGLVIVGHVDSGKSTTTGHLLFKLGNMDERTKERLQQEASDLGKSSFSFAFFLDTKKAERERGITIDCTTKEFFTDKYHFTIIDAPGHKGFINNMISGASQADVALIMVPANSGGFETAIDPGNKRGEGQGQTRQHAELCFLLGIKQVIVGINKMDEKSVNFSQTRYNEIKDNMLKMLKKIGYNTKEIPVIPMSGFKGDNLVEKSDKMPWYTGFDVTVNKQKVSGHTLLDAFNNVVRVPSRPENVACRMPLSGLFPIKGVGTILTGRIEQGNLNVGDEVGFTSSEVKGKVFTIEMHHRNVEQASTGDNVGICVKGLPKDKSMLPKRGDCMYIINDKYGKNPGTVKSFRARVFVRNHPGQIKPATVDADGNYTGGYSPQVNVRTAKAPCQLAEIHWKKGKSTGKQQVDNPKFVEAGDQAEVTFHIRLPLHVEPFSVCQGLGRIAIMDAKTVMMIGMVMSVEYK